MSGAGAFVAAFAFLLGAPAVAHATCTPAFPPLLEATAPVGDQALEVRWRPDSRESCPPTHWEVALGEPPETTRVVVAGLSAIVPARAELGALPVWLRAWRDTRPGPWSPRHTVAAPTCRTAPRPPRVEAHWAPIARAYELTWTADADGCRADWWIVTLTTRPAGPPLALWDVPGAQPSHRIPAGTVAGPDVFVGVAGATVHAHGSASSPLRLDPCALRRAAPATLTVRQEGTWVQFAWSPAEDVSCAPTVALVLDVGASPSRSLHRIRLPIAGAHATVAAPPGTYAVRAAFETAAGVGAFGGTWTVQVPPLSDRRP